MQINPENLKKLYNYKDCIPKYLQYEVKFFIFIFF